MFGVLFSAAEPRLCGWQSLADARPAAFQGLFLDAKLKEENLNFERIWRCRCIQFGFVSLDSTTDGIDLTLLHRLRALREAKNLTLSYSVQLNQDQHFLTTKLNHWWTTISPMYIGYLAFYFNERWKLDALRLVCVRLFTQTDFFFLVSDWN